MGFEIRCDRCRTEVAHVCHGDGLREAIKSLYSYAPGFWPNGLKTPYARKEDVEMPFFSEAYLYNLMGKDDARTVLALVHNVIREAGIEPRELEVEAWREFEEERRKLKDELQRRERWHKAVEKVRDRLGIKRGMFVLSTTRIDPAENEKRRAMVQAEYDRIVARAEKRKSREEDVA